MVQPENNNIIYVYYIILKLIYPFAGNLSLYNNKCLRRINCICRIPRKRTSNGGSSSRRHYNPWSYSVSYLRIIY